MKTAALVWLVCAAIYLDLLWRARSRGKFVGTFPWSLLAIIAAGLAWIAWSLVMGWPQPGTIEHLIALAITS
jgi:hypothetical protein